MSKPPMTWADLTLALAAEGYLDAAGVERVGIVSDEGGDESPWYVTALVTVSAWIGALLLLMFLIAAEWVHEGPEYIVAGVVFMAISVALGHLTRHPFLQQIGIALGVAGPASLGFGVYSVWESHEMAWASVAASALILFFAQPNRIHRFLTVGVGVFGVAALIAVSSWQEGAHLLVLAQMLGAMYLLEQESHLDSRRLTRFTRPLALGLMLALPTLLFIAQAADVYPELHSMWISSAGLSAALLYVVWRLAPRPVLAFVPVFLFFAFDQPGLIASLALTLLAYARGQRVVAALLLAALIAQAGYLLYDLDVSLLHRSMILAGTGLVLLAMRAILRLTASAPPEEEVAL
ncbi:MAG: DUF4401 domain-containing protein [Rhodothermales bacterium]|nr:DUF4401 domain-containing protein [Rhodothermales bacterium]